MLVEGLQARLLQIAERPGRSFIDVCHATHGYPTIQHAMTKHNVIVCSYLGCQVVVTSLAVTITSRQRPFCTYS
jgi:hypothetical protein